MARFIWSASKRRHTAMCSLKQGVTQIWFLVQNVFNPRDAIENYMRDAVWVRMPFFDDLFWNPNVKIPRMYADHVFHRRGLGVGDARQQQGGADCGSHRIYKQH